MQNWQLTLVVLGSVLVGGFIPLVVVLALAVNRAAREFAQIAAQFKRTLAQVEVVSDRVEVLSRGLKGGETSVAALLDSVGRVAAGLERNMKAVQVASTVLASVGSAAAGYLASRSAAAAAQPQEDGTATSSAPPG